MRQVGLWSLVLAFAATVASADPLDKPAFSATPAELQAAARAVVSDDQSIVIVRDDIRYEFDEAGRQTRRERLIFAIRQQVAVDDWGTARIGWRPFYQERPVVRGRVIAPDGTVTAFDLSLAHDAPAVMESPQVFSDRRDLAVPLPRLTVGAVVEEEFVTVDREPLSPAGAVEWQRVPRPTPIERLIVTVSHPKGRPLTLVTRGPGALRVSKRTVGDRIEHQLDLRKVGAAVRAPIGAPAAHWPNAALGFTTGTSWAKVADDYRARVEARLAEPFTLPSELVGPPTRATVARAVAWLHARVRYTGIELADSAIIPVAPRETLTRGFGDCKDKATLLVALLRGVGVRADLALLTTGPGWDTDPALPGLGTFDHVIVRAVVDGKELWIDATEDLLPVGLLPLRDQGRRALSTATGTRGLVLTPVTPAADNLVREVRDFHVPSSGDVRVVETSTEHGIYADDMRRWVRGQPRKDLEASLTRYLRDEYGGTFAGVRFSDPDDVATPFSLTVETADTDAVAIDDDELVASVSSYDALAKLPSIFTSEDAAVDSDLAARTLDYEWVAPHRYEIEHRLHLPGGYAPTEVPPVKTIALGSLTLTETHRFAGDVYTVVSRLDTGKRRLTAAELRATRAAVIAYGKTDRLRVTIPRTAARLLAAGDVTGALAESRRLIAQRPKEAIHHERLAAIYSTLGQGLAARREARLSTTLEPARAQAWYVLGFYLARDGAGRTFHLIGSPRGAMAPDLAGAEAALRQAIKLNPDHVSARRELAVVLYLDAARKTSPSPARLREALALTAATDDDPAAPSTATLQFLTVLGDAKTLALDTTTTDPAARYRRALLAAALRGTDLSKALAGADAAVRATSIADATGLLAIARRYDEARAVAALDPGFRGPPHLPRRRVIDDRKVDVADPVVAVAAFLSHSVGAWSAPARPWTPAAEQAGTAVLTSLEPQLDLGDLTVHGLRDLIFAAVLPTAIASDRGGWRVRFAINGRPQVACLAKRNGKPVLLGLGANPVPVAREIVDAIARADLPWAQRLATWLAEDLNTSYAPLLARQRSALAGARAELLELVAAMVLADTDPTWAAPRLATCADLTDSRDRAICAHGLAVAYGKLQRHAEAVAALEAAGPDVPTLVVTGALARAGRFADVVKRMTPPDGGVDPDEARVLALASAQARLDRAAARATLRALASRPTLSEVIRNNAAWLQTYLGDPDAVATIAPRLRSRPDRGAANTHAAALAESGQSAAAAEALFNYVGDSAMGESDWYVLGRIAEQVGLRDEALTYYQQIVTPPGLSLLPDTPDLALQRRAALGAP